MDAAESLEDDREKGISWQHRLLDECVSRTEEPESVAWPEDDASLASSATIIVRTDTRACASMGVLLLLFLTAATATPAFAKTRLG